MLSCSYRPCAASAEAREAARFLVKLELPGLGDRLGAKTPCGSPTLTALSRSMSKCRGVSSMGLGAKDRTWVIFGCRQTECSRGGKYRAARHTTPPKGERCRDVSKLAGAYDGVAKCRTGLSENTARLGLRGLEVQLWCGRAGAVVEYASGTRFTGALGRSATSLLTGTKKGCSKRR